VITTVMCLGRSVPQIMWWSSVASMRGATWSAGSYLLRQHFRRRPQCYNTSATAEKLDVMLMAPCLACCAPTLQHLILVTYGAQLLPVALWWCIVYPLQVPDPSDDLLAAAMLDQQPLDSAPEAIREIMEALPRAFPITVWHTINMARHLMLAALHPQPVLTHVAHLKGLMGVSGCA